MLHGEYSALSYTIFSDQQPIYTAGNAPGESQGYVTSFEGVGLRQMRKFCKSTLNEMATERKEEIAPVCPVVRVTPTGSAS